MYDDDELPDDPDLDFVDTPLRQNAGQHVYLRGVDGVPLPGTLAISPIVFGHAKRLRQRFFDGGERTS